MCIHSESEATTNSAASSAMSKGFIVGWWLISRLKMYQGHPLHVLAPPENLVNIYVAVSYDSRLKFVPQIGILSQ